MRETKGNMMGRPSLERSVRLLRDYYGEPEKPSVTDPLELILWENVAYLVDDQKRMMPCYSRWPKPEECFPSNG